MSKIEFKVWLVINGYTQKSLAEVLQISEQTISLYNNNDRYPMIFQLALKGLTL